jgi:hypothetical protein
LRAEREYIDRRTWVLTSLGLVLAAVAVRAIIDFSNAYPPGIDAAYYPMQTRSWLTHGRLMYDDLPLLFWLNAAITKVLMGFGWRMDDALLQASRISNCLLPPWTAAIVMAMSYRWSGGRRAALPGGVAAGALTVLSPPAMSMALEFQKNALGLVWMAAALWVSAAAMQRRGVREWAILVGVMILSALTHIGAFGATAVMIGVALVLWAFLHWREASFTLPWRLAASCTVTAVALAVLMAVFDLRRAIAFAIAPVSLFVGTLHWAGSSVQDLLTFLLLTYVLSAGLRRVWRDRHDVSRVDVSLVIGAAATVAVLICPKSQEYARFLLMAYVPAAMILAFVTARRAVTGASPWPGRALLVGTLVVAVVSPWRTWNSLTQETLMTNSSAEELREVRGLIADPDSTLVVASHGLEWWAGFLLHTPVRMASASRVSGGPLRTEVLPADAFKRYHEVLFLRWTRPEGPAPAIAPPLDPGAHSLYAGRFFEVFELQPPSHEPR